MKKAWTFLTLALLLTGTSCHRDGTVAPLEIFHYNFQMATSTPNGGYAVRRAAAPDCTRESEDRMRIDQLAAVVQPEDTGYQSLKECSDAFFINMPDARENNFTNKFRVREGTSSQSKILEIQVNGPPRGGHGVTPSGMVIQPAIAMIVGDRTSAGFAEIFFGPGGPVFRCESSLGDDPWKDHVGNPATQTFFEFELTSLNEDFTRGSGNFKCIARNMTDPTDTRLLIILEGTMAMEVH